MELSQSAGQPNRHKVIEIAFSARYEELCANWGATLLPEGYGAAAQFVGRIGKKLKLDAGSTLPLLLAQDAFPVSGWLFSPYNCFHNLRSIVLGETLCTQICPPPPPLEPTYFRKLSRSERIYTLCERYTCPLNIAATGEIAFAEELLTELMVHDRRGFEKKCFASLDHDELFLKLNLIALVTFRLRSLRFMDAMNYFYEFLPSRWSPAGKNAWLLPSWMCLYASLLANWSQE